MTGSQNKETLPQSNVVETNKDGKIAQDKCPKCGATDISLNIKNGKLRCNYCRCEFAGEKLEGLVEDISFLKGEVIASGGKEIDKSFENIITLKCDSCGAEVVVDTTSSTQNKCHWCRNMLSIDKQIPNGAVPDLVLPFKIEKQDARNLIESFTNKRKFYANTKFINEFRTDNIMGVYLPYLVVDVNSHAYLKGKAEIETRSYYVGHKEHRERVYDADVYSISREYDLIIEGLTIESNSDRIKNGSDNKTNNVINAIMPFDIENCVKFKSNFLNGFTSEKRDIDIEDIKPLVNTQVKDISRYAASETARKYNRGIRWEKEDLDIIGEQWKTAYLPVWLYSYQDTKNNVLHYVAVNARTKETMGSIPINFTKLLTISFLVELLGLFMVLFVDWDYSFIFLSLGFFYYVFIYQSYRNKDQRHRHEIETKKQISNLNKTDTLTGRIRGVRHSKVSGSNESEVKGSTINNSFANKSNKDKM